MFKKKVTLLFSFSILFITLMMVYSFYYMAMIKKNNDLFHYEIETRSKYLNAIVTIFGYGHTIHNFKNLIIRGGDLDKIYLEKLEVNKKQFYHSIDRYIDKINEKSSIIDGFSADARNTIASERVALKNIRSTFDAYMDRVDKIIEIRRNGGSIYDIDQAVKVDDTPALNGFHSLQLGINLLNIEVANNSKKYISKLDDGIVLTTIVLTVVFLTSMLFNLQILRPIMQLNCLFEETKSSREVLRQYQHPHDDELAKLLANLSNYDE